MSAEEFLLAHLFLLHDILFPDRNLVHYFYIIFVYVEIYCDTAEGATRGVVRTFYLFNLVDNVVGWITIWNKLFPPTDNNVNDFFMNMLTENLHVFHEGPNIPRSF